MMTERVGEHSLVAGDHGTTYGGNPLACAAVNAVLDEYASKSLVDHVNTVAPYLVAGLDELTAKHEMCVARRGRGLMQGILFDRPVSEIIAKAMEKGLIMINAGANVLRFLPPLVIEKEHVDEMIAILEEAITECEA